MADTKISQLPVATTLAGTEIVPTVQGGITVGATMAQVWADRVTDSSNSGAGAGIAQTKSGTVLPFKSLVAGANITITPGTNDITISASASSGMTNPMTTNGDVIVGGSGGTPTRLGIGTNGQVLGVSGGALAYLTVGSGTVTSVSVVSANGFGGTVATSTTTPAITLTTSLTGLLKGNGTAMSVATAGTDYPGLASANTFTSTQVYSDQQLSRGMMKDMGVVFLDKGNSGTSTQTLDYTAAGHQKVTATGNFTIALSNFPPTGNLGELLLELTNGGAFTLTWPTINWIKSDGSFTTTFASNGVTLQSSGTDFCLIWSRDGGTTYYGKFMR